MSEPAGPAEDPSFWSWFSLPGANRTVELRRRRRRIASISGHVTRLVGILLGVLIFNVGIPLLILLASAHGGEISGALDSRWVVATIAAPFVLLSIGTVLVSGQKRTILFLRRFGNPQLSERILASLETLLHHHYRLVALDDSTLHPLGVFQRPFRRTVLFFSAVALLAALAVGGLLLYVRLIGNGTDDPSASWTATAAMIMLTPLGVAALLGVPSIYFLRSRVRRAAALSVKSGHELALVARTVRRQRRWLNSLALSAPQALIVHTSDEVWQPTVSTVLPIVDVIVVDVSEPTKSLEWEIGEVFGQSAAKCVVIGSRERIHTLLSGPRNDIATRIFERIRGATLVMYEDGMPPDPRELLLALDAADARTDSPRSQQLWKIVRRTAAGFAIAAVLAFLGTAGWMYRNMSLTLDSQDVVYRGREWLDFDPHHAGRIAIAAIQKHSGYEAYELLFDSLELTRPFVKLQGIRGRARSRADGSAVLSVCSKGVCVWDTDGKLLRTLGDDTLQIQAADWLPSGQVVTTSIDGTMRVHSEDGNVERQRSGAAGEKSDWLSISADGRYAAFTEAQGQVLRVWDLSTDELFAMTLDAPVSEVAWFPDSAHLAASTDAEVLDIHPGDPSPAKRAKVKSTRHLSVSPDGRGLVASSYSWNESVLIDTSTWTARRTPAIAESFATFHPHEPWFAAKSSGDRTFAAIGQDGSVLHRQQGVRQPEVFGFNPAGTRLLAVGLRANARLYQLPTWQELLNLGDVGIGSTVIDRVELMSDATALMTGRGAAVLWNLRPQPPRRLREIPAGAIKVFSWRPDGARFAVVHEDQLLFEFDRLGNLLRRIELPSAGPDPHIAYGADGSLVLSNAGQAWILDPEARAMRAGPPLEAYLIGVSPSGAHTAWRSRDSGTLTLRGAGLETVQTLPVSIPILAVTWNGAQDCVVARGDDAIETICRDARIPRKTLAVSASEAFLDTSGKRLAVAGREFAALYDSTGKQILRIDAPDIDTPLRFRWSPDARWLVWMSERGQFRLYGEDGKLVLRDDGTGDESSYMSSAVANWSAQSDALYVDRRHGGPWIWRPGEQALMQLVETRPYESVDAVFSPDGQLLLAQTRRGLELWPSEPLMAVAKQRLEFFSLEDRGQIRALSVSE